MSSINPSGRNDPIDEIGGGGGSKDPPKKLSEADQKVQQYASGALSQKVTQEAVTKPTLLASAFCCEEFLRCETIGDYAAVALKNARALLAEKAKQYPLDSKNVMLVLTPLAGFGDILFIYKTAQVLKKDGFDVFINIVEQIGSNSSNVKNQLIEMDNMEGVEVFIEDDPGLKERKPDCIIVAPTIPNQKAIDRLVKPFNVPFEIIKEYGGNEGEHLKFNPHLKYKEMENIEREVDEILGDFTIKSGIGAGQVGIFTENGISSPLSKEKKGQKLDALKALCPEKVNLILKEKTGNDYLDSTNIFFGYAHEESNMDRFVSAACFSKSEDDLNIDIVIPWRLSKISRREFNEKCKYDIDHLKKAGVAKVEILTSSGVFSSENISENGEGKVLRIINLFPLPHLVMKDFFALSEPLTLVTGDQSFNEVMEIFDKIPLYEKMDWKIDLYESILEKSKSFPLIKAVFEGWDSNTTEGLEMIGEKTALCLEEILRSKEGKSEIELFHESIINKKNSFEKYIRKEVVRLLAMGKNAECKEENERIENEIKAIFKVPLVIGEFLNLLDNLLSTLGWSNGITLKIRMSNFFLQKIEEMDKRNLSEEVLKAIDKAVGVYKKIKAKEEISENEKFEANKVIEDLPKLLFPMIEKQIKEIVI